MDIFIQQLINGLTLGSVYAVVALGYTMVYGIIQLINFAHGELVMIGAMVAFTLIGVLVPTGMHPLLIVLLATGCAVPVCMLIAYAMERLAYRPLRRAPRLAPLITAIGVSIILQQRGSSLGGAFGGDNFASTFNQRRGLEKMLFQASIVLAVLFVLSTFAALIVG